MECQQHVTSRCLTFAILFIGQPVQRAQNIDQGTDAPDRQGMATGMAGRMKYRMTDQEWRHDAITGSQTRTSGAQVLEWALRICKGLNAAA